MREINGQGKELLLQKRLNAEFKFLVFVKHNIFFYRKYSVSNRASVVAHRDIVRVILLYYKHVVHCHSLSANFEEKVHKNKALTL